MAPSPEPSVPDWIACRACDALHQPSAVPDRRVARCARCGSVLSRGDPQALTSPLALALAGLILFSCANLMPVMAVTLMDETHETSLLTGALSLWRGGFPTVAALVLLVGVVLPLLHFLSLLYVLGPLTVGRSAPFARAVFRLNEHFIEWGMLEVYLLGMLIAAVKLREMVEIRTGAGLFCFAGTVLILIGLTATTHGETVWHRLRNARPLR